MFNVARYYMMDCPVMHGELISLPKNIYRAYGFSLLNFTDARSPRGRDGNANVTLRGATRNSAAHVYVMQRLSRPGRIAFRLRLVAAVFCTWTAAERRRTEKADIRASAATGDLSHFNGGKETRDKGAVNDRADIIQIWYLAVAGRAQRRALQYRA